MAKKNNNTIIIVAIVLGILVFSTSGSFTGSLIAPLGPTNGPDDCSWSTNINPWYAAEFNSFKSLDTWVFYNGDTYWYNGFTNVFTEDDNIWRNNGETAYLSRMYKSVVGTIYIIDSTETYAAKFQKNVGKTIVGSAHCEGEPICEDTTWTPLTSIVCSETTFTQTSNCDNTREVSGTKDCTSTCEDITWTPSTSETCSSESFTQTSNCGATREVSGTKDCTPTNSLCVPPIGEINNCGGNSICETQAIERCDNGISQVSCENLECDWTGEVVSCADLFTQMNTDIGKWLLGTLSRDALGVSINNWVTC